MSKKLNVAVLMGGNSPEYDVSMESGKNVLENINRDKYNVFPITISKDGANEDLEDLFKLKSDQGIDVCFIAMHGPYGEDGTIQKKLESMGIKYTGSGVTASKMGMDKVKFKEVISKNGISTPAHVLFEKGGDMSEILKLVNMPCFVKPVGQGSSVGASLARTEASLKVAISEALKHDDQVLIEEYIDGIETTVPVMGYVEPYALPVIEIVPIKGDFFNYESKYEEGGSKEIVPARLSLELTKRLQDNAVEVYKIIGCKGFARVDFIINRNDLPVVLEINTIPGLTKASLFPKSAKESGISMGQLIDKIIEYANE
jgi:D-alanine-D-alanine ligase